MNDLLKQRINRLLDAMDDERGASGGRNGGCLGAGGHGEGEQGERASLLFQLGIALHGQAFVTSRFDWDRATARLEEIIRTAG